MRYTNARLLVFLGWAHVSSCAPGIPGGAGPDEDAPAPTDAAAPRGPDVEPAAPPPSRPPPAPRDAAAEAGEVRDAGADTPDGRDAGASPDGHDAGADTPDGHDAGADTPDGHDAGATPDGHDAAPESGPPARPPRVGDLAIDELLVDPAGNDLGHEWIEVVSRVDEALDLSSLHVSDATTDVAVGAGPLAARGVLVLGQSVDRAHNGDAPVDLAYGTKLSLNNGADRVALCLGPCAGGVELVSFAWTAPGLAGRAVVVDPSGATCDATEPFGASGSFGTPGRADGPCAAGSDTMPAPHDDGGLD
jgi:hypothetical protein